MASTHAKGTKKTRKIGRNSKRHQAHIRYTNERRYVAHQKAQIERHLERNPNDLNARRKLNELG